MAESSDFDLQRFLADQGATYGFEWLDEEGRVGLRHGAVEVRIKKRVRAGVLSVRLSVQRALDLGLVREAA